MYWLVGTGIAQQIIILAKLSILSKILKKDMVAKGLTLLLFHNIKPFSNLWHF